LFHNAGLLTQGLSNQKCEDRLFKTVLRTLSEIEERRKAQERRDEEEQIQSQDKDQREADEHARRVADEMLEAEERRGREVDIELEERREAEEKIQAEERLEAEQKLEEELEALHAQVARQRSQIVKEIQRLSALKRNESKSIGPADAAKSKTKQCKNTLGGWKTVRELYFLFLGGASTVISLGTILPHCVLCPVVAISLVGAIVQRMVPRKSWLRAAEGPGEMH
jgi:hypothetical protein